MLCWCIFNRLPVRHITHSNCHVFGLGHGLGLGAGLGLGRSLGGLLVHFLIIILSLV
jgi:hypothetical protein